MYMYIICTKFVFILTETLNWKTFGSSVYLQLNATIKHGDAQVRTQWLLFNFQISKISVVSFSHLVLIKLFRCIALRMILKYILTQVLIEFLYNLPIQNI